MSTLVDILHLRHWLWYYYTKREKNISLRYNHIRCIIAVRSVQ